MLRLISNLIQNTTPKGSQSSDPFWEKSETALLQALMLYLLHEAPPEEQNFAMIMEMLGSAQVKEEDEDYESPLDILFDRLEMRDPDSIAVKQYHIYKQAAGKTAKSILISVGVRLAAFNLPQIAKLTNTDELDLSSMGERKVALFCCIPDADTSLNYLVGMIYSQLSRRFITWQTVCMAVPSRFRSTASWMSFQTYPCQMSLRRSWQPADPVPFTAASSSRT